MAIIREGDWYFIPYPKVNFHGISVKISISVVIFVFLVPIYMLSVFAFSTLATYWISGVRYYFLITVPIVILVAFFLLKRRKVAKIFAIWLMIMYPAVLMALISMIEASEANALYVVLFSNDCDSFVGKRNLENSWVTARDFYLSCLTDIKERTRGNVTAAYLFSTYRIEDCDGYSDMYSANEQDWSYLEYLEDNQACSGWCNYNLQLWSTTDTRDSCSKTVAAYFHFFIEPRSLEIGYCMIGVVFLGLIILALSGQRID